MTSSSNSNQPGLIAGLELYVGRQASNTGRYFLEQLIYVLASWVPSVIGVGWRAVLYRLILHIDGKVAIENGIMNHGLGNNLFLHGHKRFIPSICTVYYWSHDTPGCLRWNITSQSKKAKE